MPVRNVPFTAPRKGSTARPYLPVIIINPETGKRIKVLALIDTGADECAIPAVFAPILGHDLEAGAKKKIDTVNGITTAYGHVTKIEIEGFATQQVLIDFLPNLSTPLLGVRSFLSNFLLIIDYPNQTFSLRK
ncbi:MAG TPA: retropepsin-like aspartic protease [bacterium]|nr:retropepsin-like aspartic protease [bacterium]